jgi:ketosteroid isomerase-like protein
LSGASDTEAQIELIKRIFAAGARHELDEILELAQPDVVADWSRSRGPFSGVYRGREAVRDFFAGVVEVWTDLEYFHDEFIPVENCMVRVGGMRARGHGSGVEISARGAQVFEFEDGLLARVTLYQSKREALAAVATA